jgi:predicted transcriptional regulator of viral defense system
MGCADLHTWFLRHHLPVVNLAGPEWPAARRELGIADGPSAATCLRRLGAAGRLRHLRRGLYLVIDPVREAPPVAIASAAFAPMPHYVTTDAALAFHRLIDQPVPTVAVVLPKPGSRPFPLDGITVRPVVLGGAAFERADAYDTRIDGFAIRIASRVGAVADALAEPRWATHFTLIAEVLGALSDEEIDALASAVLLRSRAAAARLGFLLEDAGQTLPRALAAFRTTSVVDLRPGRGRPTGVFSTRWRVRA